MLKKTLEKLQDSEHTNRKAYTATATPEPKASENATGEQSVSTSAYVGVGIHSSTSASTDKNLRNADDIGAFLADNREYLIDQSLADHLTMLLEQKGLKRAAVIRDSGLDHAYVYQIFKGEKRPSRDKLICLAFGLHLNEKETQRMLKLGGCSELYPRVPRDAIILYAIQRGMDIQKTEELLLDHEYPALFAD